MTNLTAKHKSMVFLLLALQPLAIASSWIAQQLQMSIPDWAPAVLALLLLLVMLGVLVRAGAVRPWVFAAFSGFMAGLYLLPLMGNA